jgi:hypothetical protein
MNPATPFACFAMLAFAARLSEPCTVICVTDSDSRTLLGHKYVFLGKVVEATWNGPEGTFALEVVRTWKGDWPDKKRFRTTTFGSGASCGYILVEGAYYVVYADAEPQPIGLCKYEPLPLSDATKVVAALSRERHMPPLVVPDEALLSPDEIQCPADRSNSAIDEMIVGADVVAVARIASIETLSHPDGHTVATGRMARTRTLKGRISRSFAVQFEYESYLDLEPTTSAIWFVGPRLPNGRRLIRSLDWDLDDERRVRSRLRRWQILGRGCGAPSGDSIRDARRRW